MFYGAERFFTQVRRNPVPAIMGDNHTILLDNLLSIPRLDKDTGHLAFTSQHHNNSITFAVQYVHCMYFSCVVHAEMMLCN